MKRLLLYPFYPDALPFVQYLANEQGSFVQAVSPAGFGLNGKDIGMAENYPNTGIIATDDFETAIKEADTLIVPPLYGKSISKSIIINRIREAMDTGKNVAILHPLESGDRNDLRAYSADKHVKLYLYDTETQIANISHRFGKNLPSIYKPSIPIVFVTGVIENACQPDVALSLAQELKGNGYTVSVLGSSPLYEILGFNSYYGIFQTPFSLFSIEKSVALVNSLIHKIIGKQHPDVLIVETPGAIMRTNDTLVDNTGLLTFLFSQAVTPDYHVSCLMCERVNPQFLHEVSNYAERRFGREISFYHMSNRRIDFIKSMEFYESLYIKMPSHEVDSIIHGVLADGIPVYNLLNKSDAQKAAQKLIEDLERDGC